MATFNKSAEECGNAKDDVAARVQKGSTGLPRRPSLAVLSRPLPSVPPPVEAEAKGNAAVRHCLVLDGRWIPGFTGYTQVHKSAVFIKKVPNSVFY